MDCAIPETSTHEHTEARDIPAGELVASAPKPAWTFPALEGPRYQAEHHEWRALGGQHWQIVSDELEDPRVTDAREGTRGMCAPGMVQVKGRMKTDEDLTQKQLQTCTDWINQGYPERCRSFDAAAWREISQDMPTKPMEYCIDRFEYPNIAGQYPALFVSAVESAAICAEQGKRLCDEDEWTFACEGEEALPYPHGYDRDAEACGVDAEFRPHGEGEWTTARGAAGAAEMDRLFQGRRSGDSPRCKSPFGVHDMTGNVDEWTTSTNSAGRQSPGARGVPAMIMKGGYWGPVRARCRPSTRSHWEHHKYYQQGFRCCSSLGLK